MGRLRGQGPDPRVLRGVEANYFIKGDKGAGRFVGGGLLVAGEEDGVGVTRRGAEQRPAGHGRVRGFITQYGAGNVDDMQQKPPSSGVRADVL